MLPTNTTQNGPHFRTEKSTVVVEYDAQLDDGSTHWGTVVFSDVLQFEFRSTPACAVDDVVGATEVRVLTASHLLGVMLDRWRETIGWQEWEQQKGGAARYKHFKMYFDDAGCIDVIAAECRPAIRQ